MVFQRHLTALIGGAATAIVCSLPQSAAALTGAQVNNIAREVTTLIVSEYRDGTGHGSGFIFSNNGDDYYVLTNRHVVEGAESIIVGTYGNQAYAVDLDDVMILPGADLAVVKFVSEDEHTVATLAPGETTEGQDVFISGWPAPGNTGQLIRQFTDGRISGFLTDPVDGYQMIYTNVTRRGMSGSGVFDSAGRVVGVHGMGDYASPEEIQTEGMTDEEAASISRMIKPGFNYAIPIGTAMDLMASQRMYLSMDVDMSPSPDLAGPYVASEPTEADTIDSLDSMLNTLERVGNVIRVFDRLF